jgi:GTP-binding protein HflX
MPKRVWLSAETGEGVELLLTALAEFLFQDRVRGIVRLDVAQARLRALVYSTGQILDEELLDDGGWRINVEFDRRDFEQLQMKEQLNFEESDTPPKAAVGTHTS